MAICKAAGTGTAQQSRFDVNSCSVTRELRVGGGAAPRQQHHGPRAAGRTASYLQDVLVAGAEENGNGAGLARSSGHVQRRAPGLRACVHAGKVVGWLIGWVGAVEPPTCMRILHHVCMYAGTWVQSRARQACVQTPAACPNAGSGLLASGTAPAWQAASCIWRMQHANGMGVPHAYHRLSDSG